MWRALQRKPDVTYFTTQTQTARHPPRFILIGKCLDSQQLFGARVNLDTRLCQPFPLLIRGMDTKPLVIVHPYLHGYHGSEDHSLSHAQGLYAVPTSWGGQRLTTSYAVGWGLWADFKYRAQLMPHVKAGCSANGKPSPHQTRRAAEQHNLGHLQGSPPYGRYRPEIPHYILTQLSHFGIEDFASLTSFRDLPEPDHGHRFSGDFYLRLTPDPEHDTPSSSGSVVGSPSPSVGVLGAMSPSPVLATSRQEADHTKTRIRVMERIGKDATFKIPLDHSAYPRWALLLRTGLLGDVWMSSGTHILDHQVTTPDNQPFLKPLLTCSFCVGSRGLIKCKTISSSVDVGMPLLPSSTVANFITCWISPTAPRVPNGCGIGTSSGMLLGTNSPRPLPPFGGVSRSL
jgi:hypothetical protein